jgi:Phosphotransferase enzyme family
MPSGRQGLEAQAIVDEANCLYQTKDSQAATHLALYWKGRLRYTVPRGLAGQSACWKVFQPGLLGIPLRAKALVPRLLDAVGCVEGEALASIRNAIGNEAGLSCCRSGALSSKNMILLLKKGAATPRYLVKAGAGTIVNHFLNNEAHWLRLLNDQAQLAAHVPDLVAHRSGSDLCFVAQSPVFGRQSFGLREPQLDFLRKLQAYSLQLIRYEDSSLFRNLNSRMKDLSGLLSDAWRLRIEKAMRQIGDSLASSPLLFATAHNDFTPWNIRIRGSFAYVIDWEFASSEQLPLFDPMHFVLTPVVLRTDSPARIIRTIRETIQRCDRWFGNERCRQAETQVLAYMVNLCTLYLWTVRANYNTHPVLDRYAKVIDIFCTG